MRERRAVITGLGVVAPAGRRFEDFFGNLLAGKSCIKEINFFDASKYASRHAGMIDRLDAEEVFPKRLLKKLDRFSQMSLLAAHDAFSDSGLNLEKEDRERVGIIMGNALGGWGFAEEELRDLWKNGVRDVSPYQATAWFPAAPQGQISVHYSLKGFAKTIISDIASSHLALGYAKQAIETGKADIILAGGAEAPVSPYALLCCNASGELSKRGRYTPFDVSRDGYVIGEGAALVVVEEFARASARGARIYGELKGFGHASDGMSPVECDPEGSGIARAMDAAMAEAGINCGQVDYLMPAGNGGVKPDTGEARAINKALKKELEGGLAVGVPKSLFGNLLGASGAVDAAIACLAIMNGIAPTATGCTQPEPGWRWAKESGTSVKKEIKNALINSTGRGGVHASLVIGKME